MKVDSQAPLLAKKEIVINAPIYNVWQIQTDIYNWPTWQPGVFLRHSSRKTSQRFSF